MTDQCHFLFIQYKPEFIKPIWFVQQNLYSKCLHSVQFGSIFASVKLYDTLGLLLLIFYCPFPSFWYVNIKLLTEK